MFTFPDHIKKKSEKFMSILNATVSSIDPSHEYKISCIAVNSGDHNIADDNYFNDIQRSKNKLKIKHRNYLDSPLGQGNVNEKQKNVRDKIKDKIYYDIKKQKYYYTALEILKKKNEFNVFVFFVHNDWNHINDEIDRVWATENLLSKYVTNNTFVYMEPKGIFWPLFSHGIFFCYVLLIFKVFMVNFISSDVS